MKIKSTYILLFVFFCLQAVCAQTTSKPIIQMRAEASDDAVLLRWAPTHEKAWLLLNKYGIRLERHTIVSNGEVLDEPVKVVLAECLKPEANEAFKQMANQYSYGAIIAQALFGERFEVLGTGTYDVATVVALGQELQQRYVFSLYAADLCFPAALAAGWGWKDTTATKNSRYLYRVVPLVPTKEMLIGDGSLFVDRDRKVRLPQALDFRGTFADGNVLLSWNFRTLESVYNAYMLERSTDGIHFSPISDTPVTKMESASASDNGQVLYIDSISNDTTYYYRIAGLTPFGSKGAYSDTIVGKGAKELKEPPFITKAVSNEHGGADIEWEFPSLHEPYIREFMIEYSPDDKNNYAELITGIAKTERQTQIPNIRSSNYYVVTAITQAGKKLRSFASLVQLIDTIPPAVPIGLVAVADSTGIIRLSWQPNTDADLYGYRIYRAQTATEELIPLNDVAVREIQFADSVELRTLNGSVYYAVTALDERYNQSALSSVIEVRKPELVPPTPPFINEVKVTNGKNILSWVSGGEDILTGYEVYRRMGKESDFTLLSSIDGSMVTTYEDIQVENNQLYTYRVKSKTFGGLLSESSPDYQVRGIHKTDGRHVKAQLTVTAIKGAVKIGWKTEATDIINIQLYKKSMDGSLSLFRDQMEATGELNDRLVSIGFAYQYMLVIKTNQSPPITIVKEIRL